MSWFYERFVVPSEKNGEITVKRWLGSWEIVVAHYFETGPYMTSLWKRVLRALPRGFRAKRVLFLGFGAGGTIEALHKRFPGVQITSLEWDPAMVEIAKRIKLYKPGHAPQIVVGDAAETVHALTGTYDLILFDLYSGDKTAPMIGDARFLQRLQTLLAKDGWFAVNLFHEPQWATKIAEVFSPRGSANYSYNQVRMYQQRGRGGEGDPIPPDYVQYHQDPWMIRREAAADPHYQAIDAGGVVGRTWTQWPITFEKYFGDVEPVSPARPERRLILWQPITRTDRPPGWRRSLLPMASRQTGYVVVQPEYEKTWDAHAQRHLKAWQKDPAYVLEEVSQEVFDAAYATHKMEPILKYLMQWLIKRKYKAHGDRIRACVARRKDTGKIVAGLSVLDLSETLQSVHLAAFYEPETVKTSVNVALIDWWFRDALKRGWKFLDFDLFYAPGDPKSWKGFSRFKGQFGTQFIRYPRMLMKWKKG